MEPYCFVLSSNYLESVDAICCQSMLWKLIEITHMSIRLFMRIVFGLKGRHNLAK
ncbi:hypothetical protein Lalb_Chr17g0337861 [Lupinus albus]|uniref:Uncharacterized protein n=1 Tax=Lupinus albus TaxID=3870 RepID=A0A6A4P1R1_LUPAL|nr:hypothetical protein Lalb_Chr17g0337861 [Lupinus albus]